jgi:hypothetical protein
MNKVVMMRDVRAAGAVSAARVHREDDTPAALPRRGQHQDERAPPGSVLARPLDLEGTLQELVRQIQSLLDGLIGAGPDVARVSYESAMEISELRIDRAGHRVLVAGEEIILTTLEFRLLVLLAERREEVLERGMLEYEQPDSYSRHPRKAPARQTEERCTVHSDGAWSRLSLQRDGVEGIPSCARRGRAHLIVLYRDPRGYVDPRSSSR